MNASLELTIAHAAADAGYPRRMSRLTVLLLVLCIAPGASAQSGGGAVGHEFAFARLHYGADAYGDWPRWQADWPEAERHFLQGLARLTAVDADREGVVLSAADSALFDHPWLYAVEVGSLALDERELDRLREYLLRGGFLVVDDFHGTAEWQSFERTLARLFPERPVLELDSGAEAFSVLYDLELAEQIPGIRALMQGRTWEKGGYRPHWRGVFDDDDRLMIAINYNQDLGDAWEHADDRRYPQRLTAAAYRLGVNYVIYAMTH